MGRRLSQNEFIDQIGRMFEQQSTMLMGYMDERFAQVDKRFAQMDARFVEIDARFIEMDTQLKGLAQELHSARGDIRRIDRLAEAQSSDLYALKVLHPGMSHSTEG